MSNDGYPAVTLRSDAGKRQTFKVHRLVALLFVENPNNKETVNHKSGDKCDNRVCNLEWMTHAENIQHAWDAGLLASTEVRSRKLSESHRGKRKGFENHNSRPVFLRNTGEEFASANIAAKAYKVESGNLTRCCNGKYGYKSAGKHPVTGEPLIWEFV